MAGRKRDEKRATRDDTEELYPVAVLVNGGSASASEIVSGALKQLDRGVVIGHRTFGKGSVQVLYDNDDGSALKLTIAQYLTPGDVSIQSVGITPDIATAPVIVRPELIRLRRDDDSPREKDLERHLTNQNARKQKPALTLRFLAKRRKKNDENEQAQEDRDNLCLYPDRRCKPVDEDTFVEDFEIRFARKLLAQAKGWRRSQIIAGSSKLVDGVQEEEDQHIAAALGKIGVNWAAQAQQKQAIASNNMIPAEAAGKSPTPKLVVNVTTDTPSNAVRACKPMKLKVTVQNAGPGVVSRLAAVTESSNPLFDEREFVFGQLAAGESRTWTVPVKVRDLPTRIDEVALRFEDEQKHKFEPHRFQLSVKGVERPVFAYAYQLIDDIQGNKDGRAQRGEGVRLFVRVRNTGKGAAFRTVTTLKNLSGVGIFIRKGRFVMGRLEPGETKTASFTVDVQPGYSEDQFKVELAVYDDGLQEAVSDKLQFDVVAPESGPHTISGMVKTNKRAVFRAWAADDAPVVGYADRGSVFKVLGEIKGWYRVNVLASRTAFVSKSAVALGKWKQRRARSHARRFQAQWQVTPPNITLKVPTYATTQKSIRISGVARDETRVSDVYIFVRNAEAKIDGEKVFYRSNRGSKTPNVMNFEADVPLWKGANYITVFARENSEVRANTMTVVFRRDSKVASKTATTVISK